MPKQEAIACGPPRTVLIMPEISALRKSIASTLPRQSLSVDAQTYSAKDENRQHKCKRDGVPIHIILLFGATEPTGAEVTISSPKNRRAKLPRLRARRKWGPRVGGDGGGRPGVRPLWRGSREARRLNTVRRKPTVQNCSQWRHFHQGSTPCAAVLDVVERTTSHGGGRKDPGSGQALRGGGPA